MASTKVAPFLFSFAIKGARVDRREARGIGRLAREPLHGLRVALRVAAGNSGPARLDRPARVQNCLLLTWPGRRVGPALAIAPGPLGAGGPLGLFGAFCRLSGVLLLAFSTHGASSCPLVGLIAGYPFGRNPKAASAAEGAQAGRLAFRGPVPRGVVRL